MVSSGWRGGAWLAPCGLVLLLVCLGGGQPATSLAPPAAAVTAPPADCTQKQHPVVSYRALKPWLSEFSRSGVRDFSHLAVDLTRNQLLVGARNYLFRLSLNNISLIQASKWGSDEETKRSCRSKGKTEEECHNYVRVLLIHGEKLFTCGTNAFTPVCSMRQVGDLSRVLDTVNGVARCPYDPRHNSTAMVTGRGELYAATVSDFSGRDPVLYRSLGELPPLRTAQYNSKWLNEPHFIAAFDAGPFVLVFLRENAVEHECGRRVFSRVARVCRNDVGGRFLLEDTWTTFTKARLNCSQAGGGGPGGGEGPFYYDELQSAVFLPEMDLVYGLFTTNQNSLPASAVCAFNLSSIAHAFSGPFRYQDTPRSAWLSTPNPLPDFKCGTQPEPGPGANLTERSLVDAQRLFLTAEAVQSAGHAPLLSRDHARLARLAVDIVQGRDALYHVLYLATEHGTILKALATTNKSLHGCYLEEIRLRPDGESGPIRSLQILQSDRSLFVGLDDRLLKIPLERCSGYDGEGQCLGARDPYCGWDRRQRRCTTIEESSNMDQWSQNITECPLRNLTQDGGFSPWAPWTPCNHDNGEGPSSSCTCRSRSCDRPGPCCGGAACSGPHIQVANCSRNGGWTPWLSWGQCSTSCSIGFEVRQRSCNNPSPRHGGRVCVGPSREERLCNERTPCPLPVRWAPWGPWGRCSAECGGGVQSRTRVCLNGDSCPGCSEEYQACHLEPCPEVRRHTPWSPWAPVNASRSGAQGGGRTETRSRYSCRALLPDPRLLTLGRRREETRPGGGGGAGCQTDALVEDLVNSSGRTTPHPQGARWGTWEMWSACSRDCSGGFRVRKRSCSAPDGGPHPPGVCSGTPVEYQDCNPQPCSVAGGWSCWAQWSQCSSQCGGGHQRRDRTCTRPPPSPGGGVCLGLHSEEALCNTHTCTGEGAWSEWGSCDQEGQQGRSRLCGGADCLNHTQTRACPAPQDPVVSTGQDSEQNCGTFTLFQLLAVGAASFFLAALLSALSFAGCQGLDHAPTLESAAVHPATPNHLTYGGKKDNATEFKTLNKNNLHANEDPINYFSAGPPPSANVYTTTTYYPPGLGKYDYRPPSPCRNYLHS